MRTGFQLVAGCLAVSMLACNAAPGERVLIAYAQAAAAYASGDLETAALAARKTSGMDNDFLPAAILLGKVSYFAGDNEEAMEAFERAVYLSPRTGQATLWLARTYRAAGKSAEARKTCELLLSADPQHLAGLRLAACLALDRKASSRSFRFSGHC